MRARVPAHHRQDGVTLIEMMIALILLGVAMAVLLPSIANLVGMGNRAAANAHASGDAGTALQIMATDLRQSLAVNRPYANDGTGPTIEAVLSGGPSTGHDIVQAGPRMLQFWSDVLATSATADTAVGPELVTYQLLANDSHCDAKNRTNWCITRTVQHGALTTSEVLTYSDGSLATSFPDNPGCDGTVPAGAPRKVLFCYKTATPNTYGWAGWKLACNESWTASPANVANTGLGAPITTFHERFPRTATSIRRLDTITAIGIVTPAGSRVDGERSRAVTVTGVDLRNRTTPDYLGAILCGSR